MPDRLPTHRLTVALAVGVLLALFPMNGALAAPGTAGVSPAEPCERGNPCQGNPGSGNDEPVDKAPSRATPTAPAAPAAPDDATNGPVGPCEQGNPCDGNRGSGNDEPVGNASPTPAPGDDEVPEGNIAPPGEPVSETPTVPPSADADPAPPPADPGPRANEGQGEGARADVREERSRTANDVPGEPTPVTFEPAAVPDLLIPTRPIASLVLEEVLTGAIVTAAALSLALWWGGRRA